jgi:DNA-directed RNA polymerase subunit RPC12/RpoP
MVRVFSLQCISCGSKLNVSSEMSRFACGYCGAELIVEREGGTVALKSVVDAVAKIQAGTDKTAAELALRRLHGELGQLNQAYDQRLWKSKTEKSAWPMQSSIAIAASAAVGVAGGGLVGQLNAGAGGLLFALIFGVGGIIAVVLKMKRDEAVDSRASLDRANINERMAEVNAQIAKNNQIVNS